MRARKWRYLWLPVLLLFSCGKGGGNVSPGITVSPIFFALPAGATLQLNAQVVGLSDPSYQWELTPSIGSIDANGLYTAPASLPANTSASVTARAVSNVDASIFGTSVIAIQPGFQATTLNVASNSGNLKQVILGSASFQSSFSVGMTNQLGNPDLVTANCNAQSISVFSTDSSGKFNNTTSQKTVSVGGCPIGLTAGIFVNGTSSNSKFVADAAVAINPPEVVVVPGDPTRTFNPANNVITGLPGLPNNANLTAIASDLINQDGNRDAVVTTDQNNLFLLLGSGDGKFVPTGPFPVGQKPVAVAVYDFNNDGFKDVATANETDSSLTILLGNGKGDFPNQVTVNLDAPPSQLAIGDFNKDARIDLIVSQPTANKVSLLLGNGDGTFQAIPIVMDAPNSFPEGVAVADFNLDGYVDMAVANKNPNNVTVYFRDNQGSIQNGQPFIGKVTYNSANLNSATALNDPISMASFFLSFQTSQLALAVLNSGSVPAQNSTLTILSAP